MLSTTTFGVLLVMTDPPTVDPMVRPLMAVPPCCEPP